MLFWIDLRLINHRDPDIIALVALNILRQFMAVLKLEESLTKAIKLILTFKMLLAIIIITICQ